LVVTVHNKASQTGLQSYESRELLKDTVIISGVGVATFFLVPPPWWLVANVSLYLVIFIRILQNLFFIYPFSTF